MKWLIAAAVVVYLAVGYVVAKAFAPAWGRPFIDALMFGLVMLLWPLLPIGFVIAFIGWMASGSH